MPNPPTLSRRHVLQAGGAAGLAATLGLAGLSAAAPARHTAKITDLGPAVVQFSLMSAVLVGDTVYIGSRNVDPVRIIALPSADPQGRGPDRPHQRPLHPGPRGRPHRPVSLCRCVAEVR